jgi:purine nucleosidase
MTKRNKFDVMLTTDPGCDVDDQFVIAHLLLTPRVRLHGIITTHAPNLAANGFQTHDQQGQAIPAAEITRGIAQQVLERLPDCEHPPLIAGSSQPLRSVGEPRDNAGVQFLLRTARAFSAERRLIVFVIGAATDVASALLIDPTLAERIHVVALAFEGWPRGGDPFNVPNDIIAWQVLFGAPIKLTIGDLAVTTRHLSMDKRLAHTIARTGECGDFLASAVVRWLDRLPDLCKGTTGRLAWPIWDQVAVAYLLGQTRSEFYARPHLNDDTTFSAAPDSALPDIEWITSIDEKSLWRDLRRKLRKGAARDD